MSFGCKISISEWTFGRRSLCSQPPGFEIKWQESKVYKLRKVLYGLKQASRAWNKRIDGFLIEAGFMKCVSEHGVYVNDVCRII